MILERKITKIAIRIAIVSFIVVLVILGITIFYYKNIYGKVSIPDWLRPTHEAMNNVTDYHSNLNFDEPIDSQIPRIDISMDEDYTLSKEEYTKCSISISNANEYNLSTADAKIRVRGNSTQQADKKPYKIKFSEKTSLFGGGEEKSWVLLANVNDITGIHNYISMEMYRHIASEGTFVPMIQFVNLYLNGEYQGVYNLCDQVETGDTRVPISGKIKSTPEETDYLIVHDKYAYYDGNAGEEGFGWFWLDKTYTPIEIKSPDTEDDKYTKEYTDYVKNHMDEIFDVIVSKDWDAIQQCVDIDSVINGYMISIMANNKDIAYKSIYYYLPAGGKLTYGPVWDMDLTFGAGSSEEYQDSHINVSELNTIFGYLMKVEEFHDAFVARYMELYPEMEEFIDQKIDEAVDYAGQDLENEFEIRKEWGRQGTKEYKAAQTYDESITFMKDWTHERLDYLYDKYNK